VPKCGKNVLITRTDYRQLIEYLQAGTPTTMENAMRLALLT
jgi:hypothetical protein